nr:MAG TPA: hypothetical protein [Caudoviricetes sp.]
MTAQVVLNAFSIGCHTLHARPAMYYFLSYHHAF